MRTVCLIQARLSSTRFPRKVLADLNGKPVLQHVYERACQISGVDAAYVVVPWADHPTLHAACNLPYLAFRQVAEADVLGRYQVAARRLEATTILRITSDCPVLDPVVAGYVLDLFKGSSACDFASNNTLVSGYPDGQDCAVFSRAALETAAAHATDPADREHIECWFKRPENGMRCVTLMAPEPWTGPTKLSIDTVADLDVVRVWLKQTTHGLPALSSAD